MAKKLNENEETEEEQVKGKQKDLSGEDVEIKGVQQLETRTVVHVGWETQNILIRTTQKGLENKKELDPSSRVAWIKERMQIKDGNAEFKILEKEVKELYKKIFIE